LIIQVNGKVRDKIEAKADISEKEARALAISQKRVQNWLSGKEIKKVIFVPGKLINIVI
jgi:leucyl-tRNA synthetase